MKTSDAIIDTCCLINLAAAGNLASLLPASGFAWFLPAGIEAQGIQIRKFADPKRPDRQAIDLESIIHAGVMSRCDVEDSDRELFLQIALQHGDDADAHNPDDR